MWLQAHSPVQSIPTRVAIETIRQLGPTGCLQTSAAVAAANSTHAWLALAGDKHALLDPVGLGLLLFAPRRNFAIALCEATGSRHARQAVTAAYFEHCMQRGLKPVFYQADAESAAALRQQGMQIYALGEEARIPLTHFSLEGGERKAIRQNVRKLEREGLRFELVAQPDARLIAQCLAVSSAWLTSRRSSEKRFSLGPATAEYLACMPLAVVWSEDQVVAFANVLQTADRSTLSVDLMRHKPEAPRGCMDFLFARLIEWGRSQGYGCFSLGMAPLTGTAIESGSRNWPRVVQLIRRYGERYYSFSGLRRYKQKWQPQWHPRYLVVPRRRDLLPALMECAITIAGGKRALLGAGRGQDKG